MACLLDIESASESATNHSVPIMAASGETFNHGNHTPKEEWTIVLPRRGKQRRSRPRVVISEARQDQDQPWTPGDLETDPDRESKLMHKMHTCIKKLESAQFFRSFVDQIGTPEILDRFLKILGTETKMQMVIYGIGSIELSEPPRLQLSLAILMKRKFNWVGDIEVFDPIISLTESKILTSLGCNVLTVNEQGRRQALKPTLFFMPHCEAELYDNLLHTNWTSPMLNHIVIFGNSFEEYEQYVSICRKLDVANSRKHIIAARRFVQEVRINNIADDFFRAFHGSSWHFFNLDNEEDLGIVL